MVENYKARFIIHVEVESLQMQSHSFHGVCFSSHERIVLAATVEEC